MTRFNMGSTFGGTQRSRQFEPRGRFPTAGQGSQVGAGPQLLPMPTNMIELVGEARPIGGNRLQAATTAPFPMYSESKGWDTSPAWLSRGVNQNRAAQGLSPLPLGVSSSSPMASPTSPTGTLEDWYERDWKPLQEAIAGRQAASDFRHDQMNRTVDLNSSLARATVGEPGRNTTQMRFPQYYDEAGNFLGEPRGSGVPLTPGEMHAQSQRRTGRYGPQVTVPGGEDALARFNAAVEAERLKNQGMAAMHTAFDASATPRPVVDQAEHIRLTQENLDAVKRGETPLHNIVRQGWNSPSERIPALTEDGSTTMYAGPARSTTELANVMGLGEGIRERREARRTPYATPGARRRMVTAQAQGRNLFEPGAELETAVMGRGLSPDQRVAAFGPEGVARMQETEALVNQTQPEYLQHQRGVKALDALGNALAGAMMSPTGNVDPGALDLVGDLGRLAGGIFGGGGDNAGGGEPDEKATGGNLMAGMSPAQQRDVQAFINSGDVRGLERYLLGALGDLPAGQKNALLQVASGRWDAHVGSPAGEWFPTIGGLMRAVGLQEDWTRHQPAPFQYNPATQSSAVPVSAGVTSPSVGSPAQGSLRVTRPYPSRERLRQLLTERSSR